MTSIRLRAVGAMCLVVCLGLPAGAQAKPNKRVCADAPAGYASCSSRVVTDAGGRPAATATPAGYGPGDLRSAYNLTTDATRTVAIVDAYDDPNAESDLAAYRAHYGLPPCTTANGCFRKVNQSGGTKLPRANAGLGRGDLARRRHGQRDLPELPHPARRGRPATRWRTSAPR